MGVVFSLLAMFQCTIWNTWGPVEKISAGTLLSTHDHLNINIMIVSMLFALRMLFEQGPHIPDICKFFYTNTFLGLKILHSKVRKFTTKKASRQNSVNYTLCVKLRIPC